MQATSLYSPHPAQGVVTPDYLGAEDVPWLVVLIEAFQRFEGRPRRELDLHLREELRRPSPKPKRDAAIHVLHKLCRSKRPPPIKPKKIRAALFAAAAAAPRRDPSTVRAQVAEALALAPEHLDTLLFADLPSERPMEAPPQSLTAHELVARTNLHIAQGILRRATQVELELKGNARAVIRVARLQGLIVVAEPAAESADYAVRAAISGPLALFRKTVVYGQALAALLPALSWCDRFALRATCGLGARSAVAEIRTGDPIFPGDEPRMCDSKLEQRFARDFAKAAPDWDVIREPEPARAEGRLIFPDFALEHRRHRRRWLLEIVGFWTPQYLDHKLGALRRARLENLIVCIDADRNCEEREFPSHARVIRYRKKIDPADVLSIIEGSS